MKGVLKDRGAKGSMCARTGQKEQLAKVISGQLGAFSWD